MKKVLIAVVAALTSLPVLADVTGLVAPPGGGGGSSLPSQAGNSGKFLTTDGTSPSWASPTASASSVTPGTTTVVGATAPCLLENSTSTTMACPGTLPTALMPALTGDVTSSAGSTATTVSKVNGASVPADLSCAGTNSGSQFVACSQPINAQGAPAGNAYTVASADANKLITFNDASAVAVTLPVATTTGFTAGFAFSVENLGTGLVTVTPSTSTINGAASLAIAQNEGCSIVSDGTNYQVGGCTAVTPAVNLAASGHGGVVGTLTVANGGTGGTGYTFPSSPATISQTVASGTATMGTTAIASGACATVVTVAATGVATTDVIHFGFNGDPTAVTGYGVSATGAVLTIYPYPTAGNVNVKVCNNTGSSITPGAMTLNWRVTR